MITIIKLETHTLNTDLIIKTPDDVADYLSWLKDEHQEHFIVLTLDAANKVAGVYTSTIGILNKCQIHPREVFLWAIKDHSAAVIVAHNHPSGGSEPSKEDHQCTKTLIDAGHILGIPVLDHVIVSKTGSYSFQRNMPHYFNKKTA